MDTTECCKCIIVH